MPKNLGRYADNLAVPRKQDVDAVDYELNQLTEDVDNHIGDTSNPHQVTAEQVGLGNVANVLQYSASNPPPYPVTSVNNKTGAVTLAASDVGARPNTWVPTASEVGALPTQTGSVGQFLGFTATNVVGAVDAPGGGVNIQVSASQPLGQKTGDFWYQII